MQVAGGQPKIGDSLTIPVSSYGSEHGELLKELLLFPEPGKVKGAGLRVQRNEQSVLLLLGSRIRSRKHASEHKLPAVVLFFARSWNSTSNFRGRRVT